MKTAIKVIRPTVLRVYCDISQKCNHYTSPFDKAVSALNNKESLGLSYNRNVQRGFEVEVYGSYNPTELTAYETKLQKLVDRWAAKGVLNN